MLGTKPPSGIFRRDFLTGMGLSLGGLVLGNLRGLQAQGTGKGSHKSVIQIFLAGGPSQIDMYDLKPDAPAEYRGEFKPIHTNVPGLDICELMPLQAKIMDKVAIVRNMSFTGDHDYRLFLTGYPQLQPNQQPVALVRPDFGSVVSRLHGNGSGLPAYVSSLKSHLSPAYLGPAHAAFMVEGEANPGVKNLGLHPGVTSDRLVERKELLRTFDTLRRDLDARNLAGSDALNAQALEIISSNQVRDAFDISKEPKEVRARYGEFGPFLQARRLVEAGVQVVTLVFPENGAGQWDTHEKNFITLRRFLPMLDQMLHVLITDLHERGLDQDVLVVAGGELGRTPRIGKQTSGSPPGTDGRDHWKSSGFALLAGGGLRMGQAIGDTGPRGEGDSTRRYNLQNLCATMYHLFDIDTGSTLTDQTGRPHFVLEEREKISELL